MMIDLIEKSTEDVLYTVETDAIPDISSKVSVDQKDYIVSDIQYIVIEKRRVGGLKELGAIIYLSEES